MENKPKSLLSNTLVQEAVVFDHAPFADKEEAFEYMADRFVEAGIVTNKQEYIDALYYRESLGPTYMGNYIGLPHGKCEAVIKPGIGFCRCKEPFIYKSNGEEGEVKYIFMLAIAGNQSGEEYMRVLASLAGLLAHDEFIEKLDTCNTYDELINEIECFE